MTNRETSCLTLLAGHSAIIVTCANAYLSDTATPARLDGIFLYSGAAVCGAILAYLGFIGAPKERWMPDYEILSGIALGLLLISWVLALFLAKEGYAVW